MALRDLTAINAGTKPLGQLSRPQDVIRQFMLNGFAVTMGTSILALALAQLPLAIPGLQSIAEGHWMLNIVLF
ncbi:hypothetical protein KVG95_21405 [Pseudomonas sp. SWRI79]|uniref:Uncharacterized protein n=1 Tax=Pseudomonas farris TaxID=2841207 RepID=A0ABS6Q063_9PSED|nr:hypothetical protein [Pseudomonas farris]MBV4465889.1 hypothetical protein [Pseudomonas farris]